MLADFGERFDDLVAAIERIAAAAEREVSEEVSCLHGKIASLEEQLDQANDVIDSLKEG